MKKEADLKSLLNMCGEFRVCSELLRHGVFSTVTFGNRKGVDIYAISRKELAVVEVKSSFDARIVTCFFQKYKTKDAEHPDFWVLCHLASPDEPDARDRFLIFTHDEMKKVQSQRNNKGEDMDWETAASRASKGVDNVRLSKICNIELYENKWRKIIDYLHR